MAAVAEEMRDTGDLAGLRTQAKIKEWLGP
jgi:hypothetical protein